MSPIHPNFFVIGAPKAGTTSLCHYLPQHPDVFVTDPKETHYYCDESHYKKGFDWYLRYYRDSESCAARGEGTPTYAAPRVHTNLLDRILGDTPDAKFIFMARHPIQRMESYYSQEVHNGTQVPSLGESVRERPYYLDCSRYHEFYTGLVERVSPERVLVLFFEDFAADTRDAVRKAFAFLGVDEGFVCPDLDARNGRSKHLEDTPAMSLIRRLPGFEAVARNRERLLPQSIRTALKESLRRKPETKPVWDHESLNWAIQQLADDATAFLAQMGKPADYWGDLSRPVGKVTEAAVEGSR